MNMRVFTQHRYHRLASDLREEVPTRPDSSEQAVPGKESPGNHISGRLISKQSKIKQLVDASRYKPEAFSINNQGPRLSLLFVLLIWLIGEDGTAQDYARKLDAGQVCSNDENFAQRAPVQSPSALERGDVRHERRSIK